MISGPIQYAEMRWVWEMVRPNYWRIASEAFPLTFYFADHAPDDQADADRMYREYIS